MTTKTWMVARRDGTRLGLPLGYIAALSSREACLLAAVRDGRGRNALGYQVLTTDEAIRADIGRAPYAVLADGRMVREDRWGAR